MPYRTLGPKKSRTQNTLHILHMVAARALRGRITLRAPVLANCHRKLVRCVIIQRFVQCLVPPRVAWQHRVIRQCLKRRSKVRCPSPVQLASRCADREYIARDHPDHQTSGLADAGGPPFVPGLEVVTIHAPEHKCVTIAQLDALPEV
jgi:hypothetical protein